jgi:hypothetical protein
MAAACGSSEDVSCRARSPPGPAVVQLIVPDCYLYRKTRQVELQARAVFTVQALNTVTCLWPTVGGIYAQNNVIALCAKAGQGCRRTAHAIACSVDNRCYHT